MVDTAVTPVGSGEVAAAGENAAAATQDMSMLGLFLHADWVVQLIILLLFLASFWSWKVIIDKWYSLQRASKRASQFEEGFWKSDDLDKWYEKSRKKSNHPLARVFIAGMREWSLAKKESPSLKGEAMGRLRERVRQVMQVARNREMDRMEKNLNFLATIGSAAPFVGLLGTVLGIMNSFQNIASEKSTSLVVVAPGIAEALFATAIGLFAAIPAVMGYNKLSNEVGRIGGMLEDFTMEFDALLARQADKKE